MLALTLFFPKPTNSGTEEDQNNFRTILLRVSLFQLPASRDPLAGQCPNPAPHHKLDSSTMFHHHVVCVRVHTADQSAQGQPSEDGGGFPGNHRDKSQSPPSCLHIRLSFRRRGERGALKTLNKSLVFRRHAQIVLTGRLENSDGLS